MRRLFTTDIVKWRDKKVDRSDVLSRTIDEYRRWVHHIVTDYNETPFGYTEWTVTGQIAIAADRIGYYSLQEYWTEPKADTTNIPKRRRPDLYIDDGKHSYVFEIKQIGIDITNDLQALQSRFFNPLRLARDKLYDYKGEADYRCSLVVAPLWITTEDWEQKYNIPQNYNQGLKSLRDNLDTLLGKLPRGIANYYSGFRSTHAEAISEYKRVHKEGWSPFPVGAIIMGRLKPPGQRGQ